MRQGNSDAISSAKLFLVETLEILSIKKVGLVRCDSGFYSHDFLSKLETKKLNYVVAVKFYSTIKDNLEI